MCKSASRRRWQPRVAVVARRSMAAMQSRTETRHASSEKPTTTDVLFESVVLVPNYKTLQSTQISVVIFACATLVIQQASV